MKRTLQHRETKLRTKEELVQSIIMNSHSSRQARRDAEELIAVCKIELRLFIIEKANITIKTDHTTMKRLMRHESD
jgi:hypothetical protein